MWKPGEATGNDALGGVGSSNTGCPHRSESKSQRVSRGVLEDLPSGRRNGGPGHHRQPLRRGPAPGPRRPRPLG